MRKAALQEFIAKIHIFARRHDAADTDFHIFVVLQDPPLTPVRNKLRGMQADGNAAGAIGAVHGVQRVPVPPEPGGQKQLHGPRRHGAGKSLMEGGSIRLIVRAIHRHIIKILLHPGMQKSKFPRTFLIVNRFHLINTCIEGIRPLSGRIYLYYKRSPAVTPVPDRAWRSQP